MFSCDQEKGTSTDRWNESLVIGGAFKYQEKKNSLQVVVYHFNKSMWEGPVFCFQFYDVAKFVIINRSFSQIWL